MYATREKRVEEVYSRMLEESAATGLPKTFKTDLTKHDRTAITEHGGEPFAWYLYDGGTHIVLPSSKSVFDLVRAVTEAGPGLWYTWDGSKLVHVALATHVISFLTDGEEY